MNVAIRNLDQTGRQRKGFPRDSEETIAEVQCKTFQRYLKPQTNVVIMTGSGSNGLQLTHDNNLRLDLVVMFQGRGWLHTANIHHQQISISHASLGGTSTSVRRLNREAALSTPNL